ncbi:nucleoside-diphosphate kinase [Candidatus Falkowbacteria bacterium CG10_big_fil_rev_8_21_14_0_10_39_11]|uniref:nucleoside-diphosphate kinase n=1 Tax=Candidatus Falkowbacteria bacterium CG10_big_fil_rev_8_21_14_0_10_39_11 TaxID=1974565 RepID=A0A2H0V415_9BACT|nr:MAG: nucleoside-diphosphate kinase [Candidatus Falkowbacteria bacterium CG10_big_fil_rev_8_21_14_0_10_39_11]
MKEKSLVLIKPDGVQRALVGEIIGRFERCGLKIIGLKVVKATQEIAGEHYANDEKWLLSVGEKAIEAAKKRGDEVTETAMEIGQRVRNQLMEYIAMSPVIAICIEGHNAVAKIRKLVGGTNPQDAEPGTIRGDYSIDSFKMADQSGRPIQNLIHASGEVAEAEREIKIWFKDEELFDWERADEALIYRTV